MHNDTLTDTEAAALREIMVAKGLDEAARVVGLCDRRTLIKIAYGERVSHLTVRVVRSALSVEVQHASP